MPLIFTACHDKFLSWHPPSHTKYFFSPVKSLGNKGERPVTDWAHEGGDGKEQTGGAVSGATETQSGHQGR